MHTHLHVFQHSGSAVRRPRVLEREDCPGKNILLHLTAGSVRMHMHRHTHMHTYRHRDTCRHTHTPHTCSHERTGTRTHARTHAHISTHTHAPHTDVRKCQQCYGLSGTALFSECQRVERRAIDTLNATGVSVSPAHNRQTRSHSPHARTQAHAHTRTQTRTHTHTHHSTFSHAPRERSCRETQALRPGRAPPAATPARRLRPCPSRGTTVPRDSTGGPRVARP